MKRVKAVSSKILFVFLLTLGMTISTQARMSYFSIVTSSITPEIGMITCSGSATSVNASVVVITMMIQESPNGTSNWTTAQTWSRTFTPGTGTKMLTQNYFSPKTGTYYRVYVTATAKNSDMTKNLESVILLATSVTTLL